MDASARAALWAGAVLVALAATYADGQTFSCYEFTCTANAKCSDVNPDAPKENCTPARAQCLTVVQRTEDAVTSVERSCIKGSMMVDSHVGCKITMNGLKSEEVCTCAGQNCNGALAAAMDKPLRCVQCDYQNDDDVFCTSNPSDPRYAVSCPAANRCVTETHTLLNGVKQAVRYCGRWEGSQGCQRTSFGHEVCFCEGDLCNNLPLNGAWTAATAVPSPVAAAVGPTTAKRSAGRRAASAAWQPLGAALLLLAAIVRGSAFAAAA